MRSRRSLGSEEEWDFSWYFQAALFTRLSVFAGNERYVQPSRGEERWKIFALKTRRMEGKLHVSWDVKFDDDESREICIELAERTHLPVNLEKIYLTRTKVVASLDCLFRAPYLLGVLSFRSHLHTGIGNKRNLPIGRRVSSGSGSVVVCSCCCLQDSAQHIAVLCCC